MINTQLKFEGKIPTFQKLLQSQGITQSFKANLTVKGQGQVNQFSNLSEIYQW